MAKYNPEARVALGKLYENGYGVPQDYEKAAEYYSHYLGVPLSAEAFIGLYESGCIGKNKGTHREKILDVHRKGGAILYEKIGSYI